MNITMKERAIGTNKVTTGSNCEGELEVHYGFNKECVDKWRVHTELKIKKYQ